MRKIHAIQYAPNFRVATSFFQENLAVLIKVPINIMKKIILALTLLASFMSVYASETAPSVDKQSCEKPVYPKSALMNEESGTVVLSILVGPDGSVVDSKVEKSSGSKALDKATQKIYTSCKFKPGAKDGKPQQAWTKLEYVWSLS